MNHLLIPWSLSLDALNSSRAVGVRRANDKVILDVAARDNILTAQTTVFVRVCEMVGVENGRVSSRAF